MDRAAAKSEACPLAPRSLTTRRNFQETQETIQEQPPPRPPGQAQEGAPPASQILGQEIVTLALKCSRMNPAFELYIGLDYSGAQTPSSNLKRFRVYAADKAVRVALWRGLHRAPTLVVN